LHVVEADVLDNLKFFSIIVTSALRVTPSIWGCQDTPATITPNEPINHRDFLLGDGRWKAALALRAGSLSKLTTTFQATATHTTTRNTMDLLPTPAKPSAQIPLLTGMRLQLAEALQEKTSYWALTTMFPQIVRRLNELPKPRDIKLEDTMRLFAQVGGPAVSGDIIDIFHSIPRNMLESLILGTVAYDNCRLQNRVTGLSNDGPGIYVLGLSIAGRNGQFLNAGELEVLIKNMEEYLFGYECWSGGLHQTPRAVAAAALIAEVDSAYGSPKTPGPGKPRFIEGASHVENVLALLASLRTRMDASKAEDPTGKTYMLQSPQYVGCSKDVKQRAASYQLSHHCTALSRVNRYYALTVSLLAVQGLFSKVYILTAIRTWQAGQLPKAEKFVAVLAGAYVTQDGFNAREAGGNQEHMPSGSWSSQEEYVFAEVSHMDDNVKASERDLEILTELADGEKVLSKMDDGSLLQGVDERKAQIGKLSIEGILLQQVVNNVNGVTVIREKRLKEEEAR
jgi:hypothetical protein